MPKFVDCPRCGGRPEFDEEGRTYTCFFCNDAGQVEEAVALAEESAALARFAARSPSKPKAPPVEALVIDFDDCPF